jgi:hypothetical protein
MKWNKFFINLSLVLVIAALIGCAPAASDDGDGDSNNDSGSTIKLSGNLNTSAGLDSNSVSLKDTSAEDYTVVAVRNDENKTYSAKTDSNGDFSIDLPSNKPYLLSFVKDGEYIGPTIFGKDDDEANTAVKPLNDADLGLITIDLTKLFASCANTPDYKDDSITCKTSNGKPIGAGNDGKTKNSGITNTTGGDEDKDGIPNLFDADEDNDGFRNGVKEVPSYKNVISTVVESVFMSSNIWADHDTTDSADTLIALRLHVVPKVAKKSLVSSVACTSVPASIKDVVTVRYADSLGAPTSYPSENSLWKNDSYGLHKTTTLSTEQWIVSLKPNAAMKVGDTFIIRVTYVDTTYEDYFITLSYFLTDWARIKSYTANSTTTSMPTVQGTKSAPVSFTGNSLEIEFYKPLDDAGNVLAGLTYSLVYGVSTLDGSNYLTPGSVTESAVTDTGGDTLSYTLPALEDPVGTTYYVTPVAESADGQRNGEETWFQKQ